MKNSTKNQKQTIAEEISITEKAAAKITEIADQEKKKGFGLKVYVFPGGCSGFQYGMDFEEKPAEGDAVIEQKGIKLFIDKESIELMKGSKIDYIESFQGKGFRIENPNVKHTCGCGNGTC